MNPGAPSLADLDYSVVQQCMHCGMCLPHCPTFQETGMERKSPRGRIALMRAVADGELEAGHPEFADELYDCLGCLACQSACPADVKYAPLFETARAEIERSGVLDRPGRTLLRRAILEGLFTRPRVFRAVARALELVQRVGLDRWARGAGLVPPSLRHLEPQAPRIARDFSDALIAKHERPGGDAPPRFRVGLLTGCVQDVAYPEVNRHTADALLAAGAEVVTPRRQVCCGSLHAHNGDPETARHLARRLIAAFEPLEELDAVVTNAGGCGSHLRHYAPLLADDPAWAGRARAWDAKVRDIHEFLVEAGGGDEKVDPADPIDRAITVAYHPSCHLLHGQRVRDQPLELLRSIPGVRLVPLADADTCCGSAGIYSITRPDMSQKLLARKIDRIVESGATMVATANPGCDLQIRNGLAARGLAKRIQVAHPVTLLRTMGTRPSAPPGDPAAGSR